MTESIEPSAACVTVSIVSHRQWLLVRPLLQQINRWCHGTVAKVVLTLNLPEPVEVDPGWGVRLQIVRNIEPRGFGANHNAAFAQCDTPWFLVLNPDVRLHSDVLEAMIARSAPRAGLLAPRIQEPGKAGPEAYRDLLTPMELLRRRRTSHAPPAQPAWVAGMFMLLRREAYRQVGGFDERYFMYCEDVDLCARLQLAGWSLHIVEDVTVVHEAQRASNTSIKPMLWHLTSLARLWTSPAFWRYAALIRRDGVNGAIR